MKNLTLAALFLLPFFTACTKPGSMGDGITASVKSVRLWRVFDTHTPPDESYECWSAGNYSMSVTNFADTTNQISNGKYLEIQVWFKNEKDSAIRIEIVPEGGHELDAKVLLSDDQVVPLYAFRIPGLDVADVSLVTAWEGNLGFTLDPGKETWLILVFNVSEDVKSGKLQLKETLLPFSVLEDKIAAGKD